MIHFSVHIENSSKDTKTRVITIKIRR